MVETPAPARLFVALWPPARVRAALAACRDGTPWPAGARPVATANLHLTLHFLGAVPAARVDELAAAVAVPLQAFELRLDDAELWRGGTAVLRPRQVPPALLQLHADLADALRALRWPVESRAFRPHLTLARRAGSTPPAPPAVPIRWPVQGHVLVQSGPDMRYRVLRRYTASR